MRILCVGDMHGELVAVKALTRELAPDALLCCGDWGDPGQVSRDDYQWIIDRTYVLSVFGNHDDVALLSSLTNRDGSLVLLTGGGVRSVGQIAVAGISGIWAKSHRESYYITDEEVIAAAESAGHVDILMTHGCAVGLADALSGGRHRGQRCFLEAFKLVKPKVYLCGHLHDQQMRQMKDGSTAVNVGNSADGDYAVIDVTDGRWDVRTGRHP